MPPEICPNCGAIVPRRAKACLSCGADESTGWSESAQADRLGIPDENFDYGEFVAREFNRPQVKPHDLHWLWWLTALVLLLILLLCYLH
jgi:RNA polymerase subunit RPABC4/transcription elongation factor Spt4